MPNEPDGWVECKRDIYHRFSLNDKYIDSLNIKVDLLITKMIALETRSSLLGLLAGAITGAIITILLHFILK